MFHLASTRNLHPDGFERPAVEPQLPDAVLVRHATSADAARIRTVAHLDDRRLPGGPFLVAEMSDEVVAAMSLSSGVVVADPFRRTRDAADMLRLRAAQLAARERQVAARQARAALRPAAA
jgi:hypothetical protein